jgi:hypothetical protein
VAAAVADAYGLRAVFLLFGAIALGAGGGALALWLRAERRALTSDENAKVHTSYR